MYKGQLSRSCCRVNRFAGYHSKTGKILLLFHQKTALCDTFIFFHVKSKQPCLDQTQKRCVSEFRLRRETNLMQACSANQHQVIMPSITKSALVIKGKNAFFLSESAFSNFAPHVISRQTGRSFLL